MNIYDVFPEELLAAVAEKLKNKQNFPGVEPPRDSIHWKTSSIREFPPVDCDNFWYIRAASIMRKLYRGAIGINRLKKEYGGRSCNHVHLKHSTPGSGALIRRILQQLEKAKLVSTTEKNGRELTNSGKSLLDKSASEIILKKSPA
jgi:small subunit ribosomal protein S19e